MNNLEVGNIVEGKVVAIKPYGAFIQLDENHQGLVHISQVSHSYVKDINDLLKLDDIVKVKIVSIDTVSGKIALSIKDTEAAPEKAANTSENRYKKPQTKDKETGFNTLEDKLKAWLKQSNERLEDINKRNNKR